MEIQRVEPRSTGEPQGTSSPISRRTVVGVGVAAAWTIPLIQLAAAAPAAALTTPPKAVFSPVLGGKYGPTTFPLQLSGSVKVTGAGQSPVVLHVLVPANAVRTATPTATNSAEAPKWTPSGTPTLSGGYWTFQFTAPGVASTLALHKIELLLGGGNIAIVSPNLLQATVTYLGNSNAAATPVSVAAR